MIYIKVKIVRKYRIIKYSKENYHKKWSFFTNTVLTFTWRLSKTSPSFSDQHSFIFFVPIMEFWTSYSCYIGDRHDCQCPRYSFSSILFYRQCRYTISYKIRIRHILNKIRIVKFIFFVRFIQTLYKFFFNFSFIIFI